MLLFLFSCVFEDEPLPVIPRPQAATAEPMSEEYDEDDLGPGTVETSVGATGTNDAPTIGAVTIEPQPPTALSDLRVSASPTDPNGQFLTVTYEWSVNGTKLMAQNSPTLSREFFRRGDVVTSAITASDGDASATATTQITIQNAAPTITTRPEFVSTIDGLQMSARDPDGDALTWRLEGAPYGMTINPRTGEIAFKGSQVDQGGAFTVSVVVEDSEGESATWRFSAEVKGGKTDDQANLEARVEALTAAGTRGVDPATAPSPLPMSQPSLPAPPPPEKQASGTPIFQSANDY
jgi:hypothetical protein